MSHFVFCMGTNPVLRGIPGAGLWRASLPAAGRQAAEWPRSEAATAGEGYTTTASSHTTIVMQYFLIEKNVTPIKEITAPKQ
ncbi:MAG: hypothetical protein J7497_15580 [Chitinophagaceae bacterium]|nr:hypothetical protein [Chitinophagaceae bacterium]